MLMRTFQLHNDDGISIGFEISNSFFSSVGIARCIRRIKGCEIVSRRRWFSADEIHVRFSFSGKRFVVWEPFGDNSRLWVGPEDGEIISPEVIDELKSKFEATSRLGILR